MSTLTGSRGWRQASAAEPVKPNLWEVHYGLSQSGGVDLYFDGTKKTLVKAEKQEGLSGALIPTGP